MGDDVKKRRVVVPGSLRSEGKRSASFYSTIEGKVPPYKISEFVEIFTISAAGWASRRIPAIGSFPAAPMAGILQCAPAEHGDRSEGTGSFMRLPREKRKRIASAAAGLL